MNTFFLDQFFKTSALVLVAMALAPIVARRSAARTRLLWASTFAALFVLPFTTFVSPRWEYGGRAQQHVRSELPVKAEIVHIGEAGSVEPKTTPAASASVLIATPERHWAWPSFGTCVFWGWVAGAATLLVRRVGAGVWLAVFQRRLERVHSPRLLAVAREILGSDAGILRVSDAVAVPLMWGVVNPVIVLPSDADEWSESKLRAALLHEWAHVRGADCFLRLVATLVTAVHWPNPLVWLASRALRAAQEQACDDFALAAGVEPHEYATQLVAAARAIRRCPAGALAMAKPSTLGARVRAVCDPSRDRSAAGWSARFSVSALVLALVAASTLAAPEGRKELLPPIEASAGSQVTISSHFIEVSPEQISGLFPKMKAPGLLGVITDAEAAALLKRIKDFGDQTAVAKKAVKPELWDLFDPRSGRADFLTSPRVTTKSGQQAIIEIIREIRYPAPTELNTFEVRNVGVTFQVMPEGFADSTMLNIDVMLDELKPELAGQKVTPDSFYRVRWADPKFRLNRGETLIVGGWNTIRKGRQLLVFIHTTSQVSTLADIADATKLPPLEFANAPISEIVNKLSAFVPERPPASTDFMEPKTRDPIEALLGNTPFFTTISKNPIAFQGEVGKPEPRVTLKLPEGSLSDALRRVAKNADVSVVATGPNGRFVFAATPPASISERAARIALPSFRKKALTLENAVREICSLGAAEDIWRFSAPVSLKVPPLVRDMMVVVEAKQATLRDALFLAAKAASAELSVDATSFYIHKPGNAPIGTTLVAGPRVAVAREATEAEVANRGVLIEVKLAEMPLEQFAKLPAFKAASQALGLDRAPNDRANAPVTPMIMAVGATEHIAAIKTAGIPIFSQPAVSIQEGKRKTIRAQKLVRPDGITEFTDVSVEPQIGPDGLQIDLNISPVFGEEENGTQIMGTRKVSTNVTVFSGSSIEILHRIDQANGKIAVFFIKATLP